MLLEWALFFYTKLFKAQLLEEVIERRRYEIIDAPRILLPFSGPIRMLLGLGELNRKSPQTFHSYLRQNKATSRPVFRPPLTLLTRAPHPIEGCAVCIWIDRHTALLAIFWTLRFFDLRMRFRQAVLDDLSGKAHHAFGWTQFSRLMRQDTNMVWSRPALAGSCSKTVKSSTRIWYSMLTTWAGGSNGDAELQQGFSHRLDAILYVFAAWPRGLYADNEIRSRPRPIPPRSAD
jgi:hypothetical protein